MERFRQSEVPPNSRDSRTFPAEQALAGRRGIASARASLPPCPAPEAWRSAFTLSGGQPCNTIRDMKIYEFLWPEDRVAHIARHGVRPEEVEDVCFGRALVQRTKSAGANPVYYVLGQTVAGRYLFCVVIQFPDGKGFPVTARPMTRKEQRRFNQWKNR